jgi:co-chaperonin GroES (HSP10)
MEIVSRKYESIDMDTGRKQIIVIGDKVLIIPDTDKDKTEHGLYLPPSVKEKEKIQSGYIFKVGPGYPVPNPNFIDQESWSTTPKDPVKYIPLQVEEGDYALYLRDQAIEIEYDTKKYLIAPQSAILMIIRRNPMGRLEN